MTTITTSWDDGDVLDERLAKLLSKYGLTGTFYITKDYRTNRLSDDAIKKISSEHEIGAHTLTHPDLRTLSQQDKEREIAGSKAWLEELTGRKVDLFCYPSGRFDAATKEVVRTAGFSAARTTKQGSASIGRDLFELPTTLHVYPVPFRKQDAGHYFWRYLLQPLTQRYPVLKPLGVPLFAMRSWGALARATYRAIEKRGGVFHLWGHSWEIEKYGMWEEVESFFAFLKEHVDKGKAVVATNGEVVAHHV
jgi:peptidoglycan/xylan/chitin deacetylase (PgdA/CDA1 family)